MFSNFFSPENLTVYEIMSKKFGGASEAIDNMAPARGMLDKQGYTRASTCARPCINTQSRAHTQKYIILLFHGNNGS
jgi:hypothetical protein